MAGHRKHSVVVGGGIVGASIAWHLARAGAQVTVLAGGRPGGVATPCSFAWINASAGNPEPYFHLRMRSIAEWKRLSREVPGLAVSFPGGLRWDMEPAAMEGFVRQHAAWGYGIRPVDAKEAARLEPALADPPDIALHAADEGMVEPADAARSLLADAERLGATVLATTSVTGLEMAGGRVTGVAMGADRIAADEVVAAAGTATSEIVAMAGIKLALHTPPGLLVHSRPHPRLLNGLVMAPAAHMRQTADGRIVAGADFGGGDAGAQVEEEAHAVFARMKALLNGAEKLAFDRYTIGRRPMPADGFPVIGRPGGVDGLYVAVMHSGVTLAPVVGQLAAEELLEGRRDALLAPYGADRLTA